MASRLLRRQVMTLTDAAAARVRELTEAAWKPIAGLRVGVRNGGCAACPTRWSWPNSASPLDEVVEDKGVRLLIDPKAVLFLLGSQMDFKVDRLSATFSFANPNETSACGCGEASRSRRRAPKRSTPEFHFINERRGFERALQAVRRGCGQAHVRRARRLRRGPMLRGRVGRRSVPESRRPVAAGFFRRRSSPFIYLAKSKPMSTSYRRLPAKAHDEADQLIRWAALGSEAARRAAETRRNRRRGRENRRRARRREFNPIRPAFLRLGAGKRARRRWPHAPGRALVWRKRRARKRAYVKQLQPVAGS